MIDYALLKFVWWLLIGVLLIGFAIMDGYDLGVAGLVPWLGKTDTERRILINAVAPHWDGNQVWLITAGGAIFAAWPIVYSVSFSGCYWAMLLVLFSLIGRPLAFEYRAKVIGKWRALCDWGLFMSYFCSSLVFGVAFGNLFQGIGFSLDESMRTSFSEGFFELLNPFALLCGLVSLFMILMHGGSWLKLKTEGVVHERAGKVVCYFSLATLLCFLIAGVWVAKLPGFRVLTMLDYNAVLNPLSKTVEHQGTGAWLDNYYKYPVLMLAPILGCFSLFVVSLLARGRHSGWLFFFSALSIAGIIATAGFSLFPFVFPSKASPNLSLTLWDSASGYLTLGIMTVVACIFVPIVLGYTLWCFTKTAGKVTSGYILKNDKNLY